MEDKVCKIVFFVSGVKYILRRQEVMAADKSAVLTYLRLKTCHVAK